MVRVKPLMAVRKIKECFICSWTTKREYKDIIQSGGGGSSKDTNLD